MTTSLARIPCTIVTGFLGAGKTTLIRHVLANAGGRRLAVIVNEFGDVGIDGEILKGCGDAACPEDNIVELANGCLCCTVADEFVPALDAILAKEPRVEHIVIETSGLALPKPLVQAFHWPSIKSRVTVDGVVAVVDGAALADGRVAFDLDALAAQRAADNALDHDDPIEEVFEDQIACADLVVLNKCDLLDQSGVDRASAAVTGALAARGQGGEGVRRQGRRAGAARAQHRHRGRHREPQDPSRRRARSRSRRVRELRRAAARDRRPGGIVEARLGHRGGRRRAAHQGICRRSRQVDAALVQARRLARHHAVRPALGGVGKARDASRRDRACRASTATKIARMLNG